MNGLEKIEQFLSDCKKVVVMFFLAVYANLMLIAGIYIAVDLAFLLLGYVAGKGSFIAWISDIVHSNGLLAIMIIIFIFCSYRLKVRDKQDYFN